MEETILTPKHEELLKRLQALFPEANLEASEYVPYKNIFDVTIGSGPGIEYRRITRSYEEGPQFDFSEEIKQILLNSGFTYAGYYSSGCDDYHYEDYEIFRFIETENINYNY